MTGSRFTPIDPGRIGKWRAIGAAAALHDLLVDRQTDSDGRVNYGKAVGYAWIRAEWRKKGGDPPAERTLHRYMQRLKRAGLVQATRLPWGGGMKIRIIGSAKWADAPASHQLNLFAPEPVLIARGKACEDPSEKQREFCGRAFSYTARSGPLTSAKSGPLKKLRKEQETPKRRTHHAAPADTPVDIQAFEGRRALLRQQAEELKRKFPELLLSERQNRCRTK